MIKRLLSILPLLLAAWLAPNASAQTVTGTWELFPGYSTPTRTIDTPEFLYVLSSTNLVGYDKKTSEVIGLNASNRLNGNRVKGIWYNPDERYLFVAHDDWNIDLVYDDGRTISVPDLRDATITSDKTIRDVAFADGKAYVGTSTGLLVIDAAHGAVTESCLWGKLIRAIAVTDKKIMIWVGWDSGALYVANRAGSHHNFDQSFTQSTYGVYPNRGMMEIGPDKLMVVNSGAAYVVTVNNDEANNANVCTHAQVSGPSGILDGSLVPTKTGAMAHSASSVYFFDHTGKLTNTVALPSAISGLSNKFIADWTASGTDLWVASANGFGLFDLAAADYSLAPLRPNGTSGANVGMIRQVSNGDIYTSTVFVSNLSLTGGGGLSFGKKTYIDVVKDNGIAPSKINPAGSIYSMCVNPSNEKEILTCHHDNTIYKINVETGERISYNLSQAPFSGNLSVISDIYVDKAGNLWFYTNKNIFKGLKGYWEEQFNPEGWSRLPLENEWTLSSRMLFDEDNNIIVVSGSRNLTAFTAPTANEPLSSQITPTYHDMSVDVDGLTLSGNFYTSLVKEKNGQIWIGSNRGVYVAADPLQLLNYDFAPNRPKVPRNDGTNLADYLLNDIPIYNIHIDENNEKWISTFQSGLYRVSADGTAVLEHFTPDNSSIASANVFCAFADKNSNKVYIGTDVGLCIYHSTTSPAAENYDDVYAYPNPITPDYTGYITITGLMANSLVKITDVNGNVFFETQSDGGLAVWNGCDASGRRVKSGVYFVYASQNGESSSAAAVTKIVVVN